MKIQNWLVMIGSFGAGLLFGRRFSPPKPSANPTLSDVTGLTPSDYQPKITREDVIRLIEANNGSEGLNLSNFDLSGVNLRNLNLQGVIFSTYDFDNRIHKSANLARCNFTDANLTRAFLTHTNLVDATFWQTNLYEATLTYADARGAHFGKANLRDVSLYGCILEGASFWKVNLEGANFVLARIANAEMTDIHIGKALIQERKKTYQDYFNKWYVSNLPDHRRAHHLSKRFGQAAEIYMNLKNAFLSSGRYREASWAYLKERQMRRATLGPWRAKSYYGDTVSQKPGFLRWRWGAFYLKYAWLWFFDWLNYLTSGYGERPLRTLWLALATVLLFPFLYWWSGQVALQNGTTLQWIDYLIFSLGAFATMDFSRFETIGWLAEIIASIEALMGISILALLMFALGNRISRS